LRYSGMSGGKLIHEALARARAQLDEAGHAYTRVEVGAMVEVPAAAKEEFISVLKSRGVKAEQAYGTTAPRVAIGSDKAALAVALEVVCGKVGKVVREEPKAQEVPAAPIAMVAPGLDVNAIVVAAIQSGKSQKELLELIAALKA
jgi:hypothetical protein